MPIPPVKPKLQFWIKPITAIFVLSVLAWVLPVEPIDPWNLFSPQKIITLVLALVVIYAFGSFSVHLFGTRAGATLTGFFGGLISSTATTASLARGSQLNGKSSNEGDTLVFLSATCAMLIEGVTLVILGAKDHRLALAIVFIGPILASLCMILIHLRRPQNPNASVQKLNFEILPILKLGLFIVVILSVSKMCQSLFGQTGLLVLTFLVSLFEIHGSVIANLRLFESAAIPAGVLCILLAISVVASYTSKLFLIWTLGNTSLRSSAIKHSAFLFCALGISLAVALAVS